MSSTRPQDQPRKRPLSPGDDAPELTGRDPTLRDEQEDPARATAEDSKAEEGEESEEKTSKEKPKKTKARVGGSNKVEARESTKAREPREELTAVDTKDPDSPPPKREKDPPPASVGAPEKDLAPPRPPHPKGEWYLLARTGIQWIPVWSAISQEHEKLTTQEVSSKQLSEKGYVWATPKSPQPEHPEKPDLFLVVDTHHEQIRNALRTTGEFLVPYPRRSEVAAEIHKALSQQRPKDGSAGLVKQLLPSLFMLLIFLVGAFLAWGLSLPGRAFASALLLAGWVLSLLPVLLRQGVIAPFVRLRAPVGPPIQLALCADPGFGSHFARSGTPNRELRKVLEFTYLEHEEMDKVELGRLRIKRPQFQFLAHFMWTQGKYASLFRVPKDRLEIAQFPAQFPNLQVSAKASMLFAKLDEPANWAQVRMMFKGIVQTALQSNNQPQEASKKQGHHFCELADLRFTCPASVNSARWEKLLAEVSSTMEELGYFREEPGKLLGLSAPREKTPDEGTAALLGWLTEQLDRELKHVRRSKRRVTPEVLSERLDACLHVKDRKVGEARRVVGVDVGAGTTDVVVVDVDLAFRKTERACELTTRLAASFPSAGDRVTRYFTKTPDSKNNEAEWRREWFKAEEAKEAFLSGAAEKVQQTFLADSWPKGEAQPVGFLPSVDLVASLAAAIQPSCVVVFGQAGQNEVFRTTLIERLGHFAALEEDRKEEDQKTSSTHGGTDTSGETPLPEVILSSEEWAAGKKSHAKSSITKQSIRRSKTYVAAGLASLRRSKLAQGDGIRYSFQVGLELPYVGAVSTADEEPTSTGRLLLDETIYPASLLGEETSLSRKGPNQEGIDYGFAFSIHPDFPAYPLFTTVPLPMPDSTDVSGGLWGLRDSRFGVSYIDYQSHDMLDFLKKKDLLDEVLEDSDGAENPFSKSLTALRESAAKPKKQSEEQAKGSQSEAAVKESEAASGLSSVKIPEDWAELIPAESVFAQAYRHKNTRFRAYFVVPQSETNTYRGTKRSGHKRSMLKEEDLGTNSLEGLKKLIAEETSALDEKWNQELLQCEPSS